MVQDRSGQWLRAPLRRSNGSIFGDLWVLSERSYQAEDRRLIEHCRQRIERDSKWWDELAREQHHGKKARAERDLVSAILEVADVLIVVLDLEGRIIRFNRACERSTGYSAAEVNGRRLWDVLLLPEEIEPVKAVFTELRGGRFPTRFENYWVSKDGGRRLISWSNTAMTDATGEVELIVGTGIDITDRRRAEQEKEALKERVYQLQRMEALGQLAGGVAHDFDNILTVIACCMERLRKTPATDQGAQQKLLDSIEQASRQAASVTKSLLTFSRNLPAERQPLLLSAVLEESIALLRFMMPSTIEFAVDIAAQPQIRVHADRAQLQQVLMNLAVNARDAMPDGGVLRVSVSLVSEGEGATTAEAPSEETAFARITVSDTGMGMGREVRERIFEPFYTTKPRGQGTGLGLSIVESILREHGGQIAVESEVGKGTTFSILLPCLRRDEGRSAETDQGASVRGRGETVLLIGGSTHQRGIIALAAASMGYQVEQAVDQAEATKCYRRRRGDVQVFVVDVDVSGDGGLLEWLRNMRAAGVTIPAIVVSSGDAPGSQDSLAADNRVTHVCKPFRPIDLCRVIARMLEPSRTQAEVET